METVIWKIRGEGVVKLPVGTMHGIIAQLLDTGVCVCYIVCGTIFFV